MPVVVYSQIKRKCEDAFASVISDRRGTYLSGVSIVKGMSGEEFPKKTYIHCVCLSADPEVFESGDITGNWFCDMAVGIVSFYTKDRNTRANQESAVFDILMRSDLVNMLNQADVEGFHAIGDAPGKKGQTWMPGAVETQQILGGDFGEFMTGRLYCRPTTHL